MLEQLIPYTPQIIIFSIIAAILYFAHKNDTSKFNVFDYFIDPVTGKASTTRSMQVLAGITATWIVVKMAVNDKLTVDMFAVYLAALGISEGWSKFIGAKYGQSSKEDDSSEQK